jgi:maltose alpha-D-glucosyltransferase/alpha-amylase
MWAFYAPEPRMRLNLGIRRRLAPLLENDRERIEVANSLLFTLPGAPVIYYGDEIGMGDNIWLDDRDGVRTPMQWSAGTNAGFSDADADELYSAPIDDKVYGYQRLNVEAQQADGGSLWHRMRQMIATRKAETALARGDVRFLGLTDAAILAFVCSSGEEAILAVHNLSADAVEFELDLDEFAGSEPTDLLDGQPFVPVGEAPYQFALPRYGYRWLRLA